MNEPDDLLGVVEPPKFEDWQLRVYREFVERFPFVEPVVFDEADE